MAVNHLPIDRHFVANASMYDGGTAVFEAMAMAMRVTRRRHVIVAAGLSPIFREILKCYSANQDCEITDIVLEDDDDRSGQEKVLAAVTDKTACVIVQYPNAFGAVEDWTKTVAAVGRPELWPWRDIRLRWLCLRRLARWALTSLSAKASRWGCRCHSAGRTSGLCARI